MAVARTDLATRGEGAALAVALCRELGLRGAYTHPAQALVDALAGAYGWTITMRVAAEGLSPAITGWARPLGPCAWEIVIGRAGAPLHRDLIALSLLAHVVRDDVPPAGRIRPRVPATYADAVAHDFAMTAIQLLSGAIDVEPEMTDPVEEDAPAGRRIVAALAILGALAVVALSLHADERLIILLAIAVPGAALALYVAPRGAG